MVGDPEAQMKVHLYEDSRCPYCREFETSGGGPQLREAILDRRARAEYTYHEVLYANQPEESVDGFTDAVLLELAARLEGLRGPRFDAAVRTLKYRDFVTAAEKAYEEASL
ncbi:thioredoxin domain-containing protein [Streptomyces sp. NPDC006172]|uniref:thioredoxin domain-containing protein n=1 Tax=Streptomyces sp. NPDC006172 TaxID=3154470 RepID=UPI0033F98A15